MTYFRNTGSEDRLICLIAKSLIPNKIAFCLPNPVGKESLLRVRSGVSRFYPP